MLFKIRKCLGEHVANWIGQMQRGTKNVASKPGIDKEIELCV